jgi:uncharacterized protein YozE (UPF0346 family)
MSEGDATQSEATFEDKNLYENLKTYFQSSMAIFGSLTEMMQESMFTDEIVHTSGENFIRQRGKIDPRFFYQLTDSMESRWSELPHYTDCAGAFSSSNLYKKELGLAKQNGLIEDVNEPEDHIKNDSLPKIFTRYLEIQGDFSFDEQVFNEVYAEFEDYLRSEMVTYQSQAILDNFQMEEDKLELEDDLLFRTISEEELDELSPPRRRRLAEDSGDVFVIEKTYEVPKFAEMRAEEALKAFQDVVLTLRLFERNGDVRYQRVITEPISPFHRGRETTGGEPHITFFESEYNMDSEDCENFIEFWNVMSRQIDDPPETYRIALDKFSHSFRRQNENDRLLDSVIALEALYLKTGEQQEMSYRLSQRGAILLGESKENAENIKQALKDAYSTRSTLVHGGQTNVDHDFISNLHDITRRTLSEFLKLNDEGKSHEEIIDSLDIDAINPGS